MTSGAKDSVPRADQQGQIVLIVISSRAIVKQSSNLRRARKVVHAQRRGCEHNLCKTFTLAAVPALTAGNCEACASDHHWRTLQTASAPTTHAWRVGAMYAIRRELGLIPARW